MTLAILISILRLVGKTNSCQKETAMVSCVVHRFTSFVCVAEIRPFGISPMQQSSKLNSQLLVCKFVNMCEIWQYLGFFSLAYSCIDEEKSLLACWHLSIPLVIKYSWSQSSRLFGHSPISLEYLFFGTQWMLALAVCLQSQWYQLFLYFWCHWYIASAYFFLTLLESVIRE